MDCIEKLVRLIGQSRPRDNVAWYNRVIAINVGKMGEMMSFNYVGFKSTF